MSEIKLCETILSFSAGEIVQSRMRDVLTAYLASHTFVYAGDGRTIKNGDNPRWMHGLDYFYLYDKSDKRNQFVANIIQTEILGIMFGRDFFKIEKL